MDYRSQLSVVDGAEFEGRDLVVSWSNKKSADDCWLMLGKQPLRSQPEIVRRQKMRGTGEPLRLRFGLMNEEKDRRVKLVSNVIYCGQLERVLTLDGRHRIKLQRTKRARSGLRSACLGAWGVWSSAH